MGQPQVVAIHPPVYRCTRHTTGAIRDSIGSVRTELCDCLASLLLVPMSGDAGANGQPPSLFQGSQQTPMHIHNNQLVFVEIIQTLEGFIKPAFPGLGLDENHPPLQILERDRGAVLEIRPLPRHRGLNIG